MPKIVIDVRGDEVFRNAMFKGSPRYRRATDGLIKRDIGRAKLFSQRNAPFKSGKLRRAIKTKHFGDMHYMLFVDRNQAPYGIYQEIGTRAHDIVPRRAKILRWFVGGKPVFARKVRHPGIKPVLFVKRGVDKAFNGFTNRLRAAHIKVFKRLGGK